VGGCSGFDVQPALAGRQVPPWACGYMRDVVRAAAAKDPLARCMLGYRVAKPPLRGVVREGSLREFRALHGDRAMTIVGARLPFLVEHVVRLDRLRPVLRATGGPALRREGGAMATATPWAIGPSRGWNGNCSARRRFAPMSEQPSNGSSTSTAGGTRGGHPGIGFVSLIGFGPSHAIDFEAIVTHKAARSVERQSPGARLLIDRLRPERQAVP
jgi:hypothetical protein